MNIQRSNGLKGEVKIPGDKSISHRAVMLGALAKGTTKITDFLQGADCLSTMECFRRMGIQIQNTSGEVLVHGQGLHGLAAPSDLLNVGNSGTTIRLLSGILAPQPFSATLTGDASIQKRPMKRVMEPLSQMGAKIESLSGNGCAPLRISGTPLKGIHYKTPVASAQVKSCILFAGMYADGATTVTEPVLSRDHSERMLEHFGARLTREGTAVTIQPEPQLAAREIPVPGDISSAAYFIAAAALVPHSEILIRNVGINPTRSGMLEVCRAMGADIQYLNERDDSGEPTADLLVRSSSLKGTVIEGAVIPALIDELPVLAVMAAFAKGETIIRNAEELKVKESDRIAVMVENLSAMGADITGTPDGMIIRGGPALHGAEIHTYKDHRIAMSFAVAALAAEGTTHIEDADCVNISYPDFYGDLQRLSR
ncbi:MAG: 3-phosphoshikimate 1-carboxyvinyltransferase [Lachnospiraceae bacterium]|jgi:3-phosphoshikimate 1-carboxyvinyltransferase|nr:3-phosphoshikimate 1-carboxyvinyltransferase [Lachnospiraceae bacterium]